jgi:hypothetical protein
LTTRTGVPGIHRWLTLLFADNTMPGPLTGATNRLTGSRWDSDRLLRPSREALAIGGNQS